MNALKLMRINEVAELLACSRRTIERLVTDGFLVCAPVRGGIRITQDSVARYQNFMIKNYEETQGILLNRYDTVRQDATG